MSLLPEAEVCKHDAGFSCSATHRTDIPSYIYCCNRLCGFWMNFSPDLAGSIMEHPPGPVGVEMWRLNTVAFLSHPSDRVGGWKDGPRSVVQTS